MGIERCLAEIKNCLTYYFFERKIKICVAGLSGSGKTSFCKVITGEKLCSKEKATAGMHPRKFTLNGIHGVFYDIGGTSNYVNLVDFNYRNSDAMIFAVDASDKKSFGEAREMLSGLIYRNRHINHPILMLCTHNDKEKFFSCQEIALEVGLDSLLGREVSCYSVSSVTKSNFGAVEEWIDRHAK